MRGITIGKHVGQQIKQQRKALKMTQEILEDLSGVPQGTISRIERGEADDLHVSTLVGLAKALGLSTDVILGLSPEQAQV